MTLTFGAAASMFLASLAACGGGDSSAPSFDPDFPLHWESVGEMNNEVTADSIREHYVWEVTDSRDRLVPGATLHFAADNSKVSPEVGTTDAGGRIAFVWSRKLNGWQPGETAGVDYCLAYQQDCTPERDYITVLPRPY